MVTIINTPAIESLEKVETEGIDYDINVAEELKEASTVVEKVLSKHKVARNNDLWLIFLCWHRQYLIKKINFRGEEGFFIPIGNFNNLLMPSSIVRARRLLNYNYGKYLPDDPQIIEKRRIREVKFREEFSKNLEKISK